MSVCRSVYMEQGAGGPRSLQGQERMGMVKGRSMGSGMG